MGTFLTILGTLLVVVPVCYMYTVAVVGDRFPTLVGKSICLLIAHPDDEAMFFSPTVLALAHPEARNHVKILCLSRGDAAGLGDIRKEELVKSALTLGLRCESDVLVLDMPEFPDSMTTTWDALKISSLLAGTFGPMPGKPRPTIDILLTFDQGGISAHPNHISLYRGARHYMATLGQKTRGGQLPLDLYTLTTVSLLRKYTSVVDILATLVVWFARLSKLTASKAHPGALIFLAHLQPNANGGLATAWRAMTTAHKSQMVWFRYLWITFSRYMVINDLRLEGDFGDADLKSAHSS